MEEKTYKAPPVTIDYERRWVIVSTQTGEVLDDAQVYGYKSAQKAYASYSYQTWCKKHPDVATDMEDYAFQCAKAGETINTKDAEKFLANHGFEELPFTAKEFLKHWCVY